MPEMTPERWKELQHVNVEVNRFKYVTDIDRYGKEDFWTTIDSGGGDCEDYALEKRKRLMALGWSVDDLRLAVCTVAGEGHAVLTVDSDLGTYVLDNNMDDVVPWKSLSDYEWIVRQAHDGPYWVRIDAPKAT